MDPGGARWITARTSERSTPMPKALVATTTRNRHGEGDLYALALSAGNPAW
jgi:hypothetical protein